MEDSEIIDLFYARSERAIMELSAKYGRLCTKVALNILKNELDAEECVNDTLKPNPLRTYICRIVRNLAAFPYFWYYLQERQGIY